MTTGTRDFEPALCILGLKRTSWSLRNLKDEPEARAWAQQFSIVVWWATWVEVHGAIARLYRLGDLKDPNDALAAREALARGWIEIVPGDEVRDAAINVLDRYPLRAADGLQLAAALIWCGNRPAGRNFICADERLCDAAAQAGFTVLRP